MQHARSHEKGLTFDERVHQLLQESTDRLRQSIRLPDSIVQRAVAYDKETQIHSPELESLGFGGE